MKPMNSYKKSPNSSDSTLILMSRWPASGRCKRRLASQIGKTPAASIQNKLTNHVISVAKTLEKKNQLKIQFAITGLAPKAADRWGKNKGINNVNCQGIGNLGLRMRRQIIHSQRSLPKKNKGSRCAIILGTDLPFVTTEDIELALHSLQSYDLVVGPSKDGGYWLIGFSNNLLNPIVYWPFCGIPWGTNRVLSKTIDNANKQGYSYILLREQADLDNLNDLEAWQA